MQVVAIPDAAMDRTVYAAVTLIVGSFEELSAADLGW